jgi:hypothetical protein
MNNGMWLFHNQALIMKEYDGFENPRSIAIDRLGVWARVLKFHNNYLKREEVIKGMRRTVGHVIEVQSTLSAGFVGV